MINFWYIKDFHGPRKTRIGASDICKMICNPENPTESLAGYGNTAVTLWKEKTGQQVQFDYNLSAEMGHYLENKALELFIRRFSGYELGQDFIHNKMILEDKKKQKSYKTPEYPDIYYQISNYKHNTQYYNDDMIAHPDCVYVPGNEDWEEPGSWKKTVEGIIVDFSKPFIIEDLSNSSILLKNCI